MKKLVSGIKNRVLRISRKIGKVLIQVWLISSRPFKKLFGKIIIRLPYKYRIKIYSFEKKLENPRVKYTSIGLAILLLLIPLIVYQFKFNDHGGLPWNEKIADGAWILHNRKPIQQVLASPKKGPNLKESRIRNQESGYRWSARLPSGTVFEFGGVSENTPEGKVTSEVKITGKDGWFVRYSPKYQTPNPNYQFVTPNVKGNIIEWQIADGVVARYEMLSDRVKADYIVKDKSSLANNRLDFEVLSGKEGSEAGELIGELMPEGNINWFAADEASPENIFIFPVPVSKDSKDLKITSQYGFSRNSTGVYSLSIVLEASELRNASFPVTVDPIVIDASSATTGTAYGNSRKILKDGYGNLLALFDGGTGDDNVYYKNYNSVTWSDAGIDLDEGAGSAQNISADIDSAGNVYAAFKNSTDNDLEYAKIYVIRNGNNTISRIVPLSVEEIDTSDAANRPSLTVANKGGGEGLEKVVISYGVSAAGREEARVVTRDIRSDDYSETILNTSGLVGYFKLGESSSDTAYDLSSTKNNGSYSGSPTRGQSGAISGESDTATRFNGSSQYVSATDNNAYDFGTGDFSVELWVLRSTSPAGSEFLVAHSGDNDTNDWELFWASGNDKIASRIYTVSVDSGLEDISDGKWHQIVLTMDRDGYGRIYKDGVLSGTPTDISSMASLDLTNLSPLYIARRATAGYFAGSLDDVSIYNKVLSEDEIIEHYNKGFRNKYYNEVINTTGLVGYWKLDELSGTNANDESSINNDGTYTGGYTLGMQGGQPGASSSAVRFNGSTGYVTIPDNNAYSISTTNELSVAFWSVPSASAGDGAVVGKGDGGGFEWAIFREPAANSFYAVVYQTGGASSVTLPGPNSLSNDRSYFVVLTMNEATDVAKLYINGLLVTTVTTWTGSRTNGTSPVNIGRHPNNSSYYTGNADEVSIFNRILTDDEIQTFYDYGITWRNASEEKFSATSCTDNTTDGGNGLPNSTTCRGTTDQVLNEASNTSHHSVVNQFPVTPKRSPDSVKWDVNGVFSNLTNTFDNSTSTNNNMNAFTTADYLYIGDDKPFSKVTFDMNNVNSNTVDFNSTDVEYCSLSYDGSTCTTWSDLPDFRDNTDNGTSVFKEDGSIFFSQPDGWAKATVNSTTDKYWIRLRPSAAMDSQVEILEIYINDRGSGALLVTGGIDNSNDLRTSYIVWDDITNSRWENNPAVRGDGTRDDSGGASSALDVNGANWTTYTNFPLSTTVDTKNNRIYVGYVEDNTTDVMRVKTISTTKDPTIAANWTDTGFPTVTEGTDLAMSLSSDQSDIYAFYILDPGTNSLVFRRCAGIAASHNGVCDSANDWGSEKILYEDITVDHPTAIATKLTSDVVAFDMLLTNETNSDVLYERRFSEGFDKEVAVASSTDDAFHRDCRSGTDDNDVTWTGIVVGLDEGDGQCVASADADDHGGFRFPAIEVGKGVKISSAYIEVTVQRVWGSGNALDFTIYGEDTDDSAAFPSSTNCTDPCSGAVGTRTRTTTSNAQSIDFEGDLSAYGQGVTYRFDVADMVQEIICRGAVSSVACIGDFVNTSGNWASGNDLGILMISNEAEDNQVEFFSYNHTTTADVNPKLVINCETSCTASSSATVSSVWCQIGTVGGSGANDCNENWTARKKVTFDNRASSTNLTNFPVLVRLDSNKIDYSKVQDAGQDLRFVDADGTTLLDYEIETWNESGESLVWVEVPQIDSGVASDFVWVYYNNSAASAGEDEAGTWGSYLGVWHLKEDPSGGAPQMADSLGANSGTSNGSMTSSDLVNGQIDGALDFDGSNDYISLGNNASLEVSLPMTISGWVQVDSLAANMGLFTNDKNGTSNHTGAWITALTDGRIEASYGDNSGCNDTARRTKYSSSTARLISTSGGWYHVAATIRGATDMSIYINGQDVGGTYEGTGGSITYTSNVASIGRVVNCASGNYIVDGRMDEVRFENSSLSEDWIEAEYLNTKSDSTFVNISAEQEFVTQEESVTPYSKEILSTPGLVGYFRLGEVSGTPIARDLSSTGNDGTYINSPTLGVSGAILGDTNTAATFTSTSTQYVNAPDNNVYDFGTGDYTLELWAKKPTVPGASQFILGHSGAGGATDWEMYWRTTDGLQSRIGDATCNSGTSVDITDDIWHHIVVTMDRDGMCTWYIDGEVSGTPTDISAEAGESITNTSQLYIGRRAAGNYFDGSIDEVAIYKGVALTTAQVKRHYQLGSGAPISSTGTKKFSKGFTSPLSTSVSDLGYSFSTSDYVAVEGNDNTYSVASGNLDASASPSASPMFLFKVNNPSNSNATQFSVNAVVKSSVPPSARPIYLQVYNGNIDNWTTIASLTSGSENTEATLAGSSSNFGGDLSAFYHNESPGTGTRYSECSNGSSNCWLYFRLYQDAPGSYVSENLSLDMFNLEFGETQENQSGLRGKTRLRGGTRIR